MAPGLQAKLGVSLATRVAIVRRRRTVREHHRALSTHQLRVTDGANVASRSSTICADASLAIAPPLFGREVTGLLQRVVLRATECGAGTDGLATRWRSLRDRRQGRKCGGTPTAAYPLLTPPAGGLTLHSGVR